MDEANFSYFINKTVLNLLQIHVVDIRSWIQFEAIKAVNYNLEDLGSLFKLQRMQPIMEPPQWQLCIMLV